MRKLKLGKYGLKENPKHLHCTMKWNGSELLGEIIGLKHSEVTGSTCLFVKYMNGELWPINPHIFAVDILQ